MYRHKSLAKYLDELAAKLPVPGGGSAAALTAALGAALINMVVNFSLTKAACARYQRFLSKVLRQSEQARRRCLELVDSDAAAYKSGSSAQALTVPYKLCLVIFRVIKICPQLADKSNKNLASDIAVAAALLEAAFCASVCNIEINLKSLKRSRYSILIERLRRQNKQVKKIRAQTEAKVGKIIGR